VKSQRKSHAGRGAVLGLGIFVVLSALCLLTPLRPHVLAAAGRETAALHYEMRAERDTMDVLQARGSSVHLTPAERASLEQAREAYVATRERIDARERMNERFSMLGLFDWIHELYPWLLAFGLALPALGGLIGVQAGGPQAAGTPPSRPVASAAASGAAPVPPVAPPPPPRPASVIPRTAYVHPATAAAAAAMATPAAPAAPPATPAFTPALRPLPGSPVVLPPDILAPATPKPPAAPEPAAEPPASAENTDWGFRHQPTPMESRPRPKMPPVRSPHLTDPDVTDPDENSGV